MFARLYYRCALATLLTAAATLVPSKPADAREVFATTFYQFGLTPPGDPDSTLNGIIRIDLDTGIATPFVNEVANQFQFFTDVAVGPHDGLVYASTLLGTISRFDPTTNAFIDTFDFFPGSGQGNAVNTLHFQPDGTLYAAVSSNDTGFGSVVQYDPSGVQGPDVVTGLAFPSSIAVDEAGQMYVATGNVGGPGQVLRVDDSTLTPVVSGAAVGGGSGITYVPAPGDYDTDYDVDEDDYLVWQNSVGGSGAADGNGNGVVDAADYTVWRDNVGAEAQLIVTDFDFNSDFMGGTTGTGNELFAYNLATETGASLTDIPVALPHPLPLPPDAWPTNFPSEALLTPEGTLLVSTLGPTQRPLNNATLLEFDLEGNLLQVIQSNLPPISGIAFAPEPVVGPVPEPSGLAVALGLASLGLLRGRR